MPGHRQVEQDDVRVELRDPLHGVLAAARLAHVEALAAEVLDEHLPELVLVVHDEDARGRARRGRARSSGDDADPRQGPRDRRRGRAAWRRRPPRSAPRSATVASASAVSVVMITGNAGSMA